MHRINNIAIWLVLLCAGLLQATAFEHIAIGGVKPDLLLVLVIFFSLYYKKKTAFKTGLLAGLVKDITSSSILGGYTISFIFIALILNRHQRKFYKEMIPTQVILCSLCYIMVFFFVITLNLISDKSPVSYCQFLAIACKGALYTGLIAPAVFFILSKALRTHPLYP